MRDDSDRMRAVTLDAFTAMDLPSACDAIDYHRKAAMTLDSYVDLLESITAPAIGRPLDSMQRQRCYQTLSWVAGLSMLWMKHIMEAEDRSTPTQAS